MVPTAGHIEAIDFPDPTARGRRSHTEERMTDVSCRVFSEDLLPHGHGGFGRPEIVSRHLLSEALIVPPRRAPGAGKAAECD